MDAIHNDGANQVGRRDAIKKGLVGGALAASVWNAPRVDGLTVRPVYASAQSPVSTELCLSFDGNQSFSNSTVFTLTIDGVPQPAPTAQGQQVNIPICGAGNIRVQYANQAFNQQVNGELRPQGSAGGAGQALDVTMTPSTPAPLMLNGIGASQLTFQAQTNTATPPQPGPVKMTFTYVCGI